MDSKTFTSRLARRLNIERAECMELVQALGDAIGTHGAELDAVAVPGFGTFEPRMRRERINVQPVSGRRLLLPPKVALTFRPSALLRQKLKDVRPAPQQKTSSDNEL